MSDQEPTEPDDDLIEQHLRAVAQGAVGPDLSDLDPAAQDEARQLLDIVDALVNAGPAEIPLPSDPVAVRLGLVEPPDGPPVDHTDDAVTDAVREAERRYSFVASPALTDATPFERRFECRSMVEHVLVVVTPEPRNFALNAAHARSAFALSDEISAVAYSSADGETSGVLTYGDCHDNLSPATGWRSDPEGLAAEPLVVALGRYFEQSDPRWETVQTLSDLDAWDGLAQDVAAVVAAGLQRVEASRPQLPHKQAARGYVVAEPETVFREWVTRIQRGDVGGPDVAEEIYARVWGSTT